MFFEGFKMFLKRILLYLFNNEVQTKSSDLNI